MPDFVKLAESFGIKGLRAEKIEDLNNVIVLAATNKIEYIDKSLLRSGRFDLLLETSNPHIDDILKIFHLKKEMMNLLQKRKNKSLKMKRF